MAALFAALVVLSGCAETGQMVEQPRYNPLASSDFFANGSSARPFVPGTVPYNSSEISVNSPAVTGLDENGDPVSGIPVPVTPELLQKGKERYTIYCVPCHNANGDGNGMVVLYKFPKPPSLLADPAKALTSGEMFEIIQNGRGIMFPYGYRVKAPERWGVIAYIRALQMKDGKVDLQTLTPEELNQIGKQP